MTAPDDLPAASEPQTPMYEPGHVMRAEKWRQIDPEQNPQQK